MIAERQLLTGRVVAPDRLIPEGAVAVEGERVVFAGPASQVPVDWWGTEPPSGWSSEVLLAPGLVDVHCHGGGGSEFGADEASGRAAAEHHHRRGTTSVVASLVSASSDAMVAGVAATAALTRAGLIAGVHLEGPFLSVERRGAQDPAALSDVDLTLVERMAAASAAAGVADALLQMTYAPERDPGARLPGALSDVGCVAALGHTDCGAAAAADALATALDVAPRGGRPLVTHVFNGMPPLHHRSPGPVAASLAQAARGEAVLEVIADGVHLDPFTVRMLFDLVGPDAICLVSDAMAASGMPSGQYTLGGRRVQVEGRVVRLVDDGALAGGVATALDLVRFCVQEADVPLVDAIRAASATPAEALALEGVGALAPDRRADVLVLGDDLALRRVMRAGAWLE